MFFNPFHIAIVTLLLASTFQQTAAQTIAEPFKILRQEEDYSYMRTDANLTSFLNRIKFIPLDKKKSLVATLGGELRLQYERYQNENWGDVEKSDKYGYLLQRVMVHADIKYKSSISFFVQLKSAVVDNKKADVGRYDKNVLDVHQLFLEAIVFQDSTKKIFLRAGRQELLYGAGRLLNVADMPNTKISFEGGLAKLKATTYAVDFFVVRPVVNRPGVFDDGRDTNVLLWGLYSSKLFKNKTGIDLYYIGANRKEAPFVRGVAHQQRHTTGMRYWTSYKTAFNYNIELIYQWGKFGSNPVRAFYLSSELSYSFPQLKWQPALGLANDVVSGDNPATKVMRTFDALYQRPYFGLATPIGSANVFDVRPNLTVHPRKGLICSVDADLLWRYSANDALYNPGVHISRPVAGSTAKYIGPQYNLEIDYQLTANYFFILGYSVCPAGTFIKETGKGRLLSFLLMRASFKF